MTCASLVTGKKSPDCLRCDFVPAVFCTHNLKKVRWEGRWQFSLHFFGFQCDLFDVLLFILQGRHFGAADLRLGKHFAGEGGELERDGFGGCIMLEQRLVCACKLVGHGRPL